MADRPSCRLASAHVGSLPRSIMTASSTFSTSGGGLPYDLISVMSFLFNASNAYNTSHFSVASLMDRRAQGITDQWLNLLFHGVSKNLAEWLNYSPGRLNNVGDEPKNVADELNNVGDELNNVGDELNNVGDECHWEKKMHHY